MKRTLQTLAYLTPGQFFYRLKYLLTPVRSLNQKEFNGTDLNPIKNLPIPRSKRLIKRTEPGFEVTILNISKSYNKSIDWADDSFGQLWNYHLQYADFLKQDDLSINEKEELLIDLYKWLISGKLKPEPYPASLRIMNTIRFLSILPKTEKKDKLTDYLYSELHFLENRLEYHLLGNHLMENAFALLMGGTFFKQESWINLGSEIFYDQVPEQILNDGGHIERSPMYHLILLFRFLEAIYYLPTNSDLHSLFTETAQKMLGWIDQMSFQNGDLAHFNDSTDDQSYSKTQILQMAEKCGITEYQSSALNASGYRRFEKGNNELLVDACGIKPEYQPGHAHADSLSFILYFNGMPIIVDPGVSTYESGERRNWERSTKAHNTVTFKDENTADVWGKFRVAKRPDIQILKETDSELKLRLRHSLKSNVYFEHERRFTCSEKEITISDSVNFAEPVEGRIHFHPDIKIQELTRNRVILVGGIKVGFSNISQVQKFSYQCSKAFNLRTNSTGIRYRFKENASIRIITPST